MPFWFRKKPPREMSPGGSIVHRYEAGAADARIADAPTLNFATDREIVYKRFFGEPASVFHEVVSFAPHVDVFTYAPGHNARKCYTLVTGGMSDLPMNVPPKVKRAARRVELIFYCSEPKNEYLETMRRLAHFPHDAKTWIGAAHTMPNWDPPEPFWGSAVLDSFLFMPTIVVPDHTLSKELAIASDPVHFLWLVPLTTPECNLKLEKGFDAILDLFEKNRHPHVFDPDRKSYV